ncbi:fibrobacter succinogenes major paralogous domain-containing protein [Candidatus Saccharibacteria bacterium]|nr:fibrobacter succinogenes major paralogous domain-containing protein [Candidatus Saccharibacteria bacterium]MCL1963189.1 fibrobacter succinogenes major paralogous domain-containing protein [Candidatus Saccharibacteria bacterium]
MLVFSLFLATPAHAATTSHQIKINVFDSTSLTTIMEACDEIKQDQLQNHTYTNESYENLMEKCEAGQETLDCLETANDASECNDPDEEIGDIEDAINELETAPDPDPDSTNPTPTDRNIPTAPNTGITFTIFGKTITIPTVPFVLLTIATVAAIIGACLVIKYKRTNRSSDANTTTRDRSERCGKESILYQSISTLSVIAIFGILIFALASTNADPILNTNDEPTSIATISNVIINVDKKNETSDPIEKTATITTVVTTENATGYTMTAKLGNDSDTSNVISANIIIELNAEELTATATEIYSSDDDTSPDTENHHLVLNIPTTIPTGTYGFSIIYETEDNELPIVPSPLSCAPNGYYNGSTWIPYNGIDHGHIGTMQSKTSSSFASWNIGDYATVSDIRNDQDYVICKLADGHVWMLNNLKLGSTTGTTLLTPANTNITSNWALPQLVVSGAAFVTPYAYGPVPGATDNIADNTFYGYLYNWCAATAGGTASGGSNTCTEPGAHTEDATGDICPINWRLPTSEEETSEFAWLNAKMDDPSASSPSISNYYQNWQFSGPFRGVRSGVYDPNFGRWDLQGATGAGFWWSSSPYSSGDFPYRAFGWSVGSSSASPSAAFRVYGFAIRCILKY